MEDKDPLAPELPLPPLKKPKLEKESDEESRFVQILEQIKLQFFVQRFRFRLVRRCEKRTARRGSNHQRGSRRKSTSGIVIIDRMHSNRSRREAPVQNRPGPPQIKNLSPQTSLWYVRQSQETIPGNFYFVGLKIKATENHVFQFKITLVRGGGPQIWRRIQVPGSHTFHDLHLAIQKSMGWKSVDFDYHLHSFEIVNPATGMDDTIVMADDVEIHRGELGEVKNEDVTKIIDYFTVAGHTARYEYDFGMSWIHQVLFEDAFVPNDGDEYPKCVGGQKACPPEDGVVSSDEEYDSDTFDPNGCF
jgi:hypothetical protein